MKILYITTSDPKSQGDYQEISMLHGLRAILGKDCIDFPRKKIMYGDFSESPKNELHGWGFSLLTEPIKDIEDRIINEDFVLLYGVTDAYNVPRYDSLESFAKKTFWLDGHDHSKILKKPCFKRELFEKKDGVYPTGFGIPEHRIMPINLNKKQLIQNTAPPYALFGLQILGIEARKLYCFNNEEDYYNDMSQSCFGLTCKKGGWDSLRHYEILASGACLLFRDHDSKPPLCSPQNLPCFSYSSEEELNNLINRLTNNRTTLTQEYIDMVHKQREWLLQYGTTQQRALKVLEVLYASV